MSNSFSRCPTSLWQGAHQRLGVLNESLDGSSSGLQPVMYKGQALSSPLGDWHDVGDKIDFAEVNWRTGCIRLFLDADDALNKVPSEVFTRALPPCPPRQLREYLSEGDAFLRRGHSLGAPQCRCRHGLEDDRANQLGLSLDGALRTGACLLSCVPVEVTAEEMSAELGVYDVTTSKAAGGEPVLPHLLQRFAAMRLRPDGSMRLWSARVHVGVLRCRADLCTAIADASPFTFRVPPGESYPGMRHDVQELLRTGAAAEPEPGLLHWRDPQYELQVDPLFKAMWHHSGDPAQLLVLQPMSRSIDASRWHANKRPRPSSY